MLNPSKTGLGACRRVGGPLGLTMGLRGTGGLTVGLEGSTMRHVQGGGSGWGSWVGVLGGGPGPRLRCPV